MLHHRRPRKSGGEAQRPGRPGAHDVGPKPRLKAWELEWDADVPAEPGVQRPNSPFLCLFLLSRPAADWIMSPTVGRINSFFFGPPIQMLISSRNTLTHIPHIMVNQISMHL